MERFLDGERATPPLRLTEFSGFRSVAPRSLPAGDETGKVLMSNGTPLMKLVDVVVKNDWPSEGARKPVAAAPRKATPLLTSSRAATLPVVLPPKSL